jgi:hypothetical protein
MSFDERDEDEDEAATSGSGEPREITDQYYSLTY